MSQFKVYQDYSADATLVSNVFIDNYMQDANDAQIKIYLYLLRVICANKSCSISDLADRFNYTEKDVARALRYWEKVGIIGLDYDESKNLIGVRLLNIVQKNHNAVSLAPVVPFAIRQEENKPQTKESVKEESAPVFTKKTYSYDDIAAFKEDAKVSELLFVVEQYLSKTLTLSDINTVLFFYDELKFSPDLIDYLFDYCVSKGKQDFRYIEKVALSWKEAGITTPKMASRMLLKYDKYVYTIMNALGKNTNPTKKEAQYCCRWVNELGFDLDVITEACERTVLATDSHRFEYADKILSTWFENNIHHKDDIKAYEEERKKTSNRPSSKNASSFNKFEQRDYDFDALEKQILSN